METKNFKNIIDETIYNEIKKRIMEETENMEVYHIMCDGEPIDTFDTMEKAEEALPKYKKSHPDKELIIEKGEYQSHEDMIEKLDKMGEELEETENMENNMDEEYETTEGNEFTGALMKAKEEGKDKFTVDGKEYDVKETWSKMDEDELYEEESVCSECGGMLNEEGQCNECGTMKEGKSTCSECGGMLNEEGMCNECGTMKESKKKKLRLKESEFVGLIREMLIESMKGEPGSPGVPGVTVTKRAQRGSEKENNDYINQVQKKMKDYLKFDGNDNPEFPNAIGKGDKMAINNTEKQDEELAKNFAGLQNLDYDLQPSEKFIERMRKAIEGHSTMGNAPTTETPSIKPSNKADKGKVSKEKIGNVVNSDKAKQKLKKQIKGRETDKKNRVLYDKENVPVSTKKVNESTISKAVLLEELEKIKKLSNYNKKTQ